MSQHRRQCLAGLRLLAITSGTAVVRGILGIASNPRASSPRLVTDSGGVTQPKGTSFSVDMALRGGNPAGENLLSKV